MLLHAQKRSDSLISHTPLALCDPPEVLTACQPGTFDRDLVVDFCFRASLVGKDICVAPGGQPLRAYKPRLVGSFLCQKSLQFSLNHALLDALRSFEIVFSQSRCTHALACSTSATSLRCLHPAGFDQWLAARLLCWARGTVKRMDYTYRMLAVCLTTGKRSSYLPCHLHLSSA